MKISIDSIIFYSRHELNKLNNILSRSKQNHEASITFFKNDLDFFNISLESIYNIFELSSKISCNNTTLVLYKIVLNNPLVINFKIDNKCIKMCDDDNKLLDCCSITIPHMISNDQYYLTNEYRIIKSKKNISFFTLFEDNVLPKWKFYTNYIKCIINLQSFDTNILEYLDEISFNKIKTYYLCVKIFNKQHNNILNRFLAYNIFIDSFKNDIIMILNK